MKEILFSLLKPYELSISLINEIIKTIKSKKEKTINHIHYPRSERKPNNHE